MGAWEESITLAVRVEDDGGSVEFTAEVPKTGENLDAAALSEAANRLASRIARHWNTTVAMR